MNREDAKRIAPVMAAYGAGQDVEWQDRTTGKWLTPPLINFNPGYAWRIKPKPREVWVVIFKNHPHMAYFSRAEAEQAVDMYFGTMIGRFVEPQT